MAELLIFGEKGQIPFPPIPTGHFNIPPAAVKTLTFHQTAETTHFNTPSSFKEMAIPTRSDHNFQYLPTPILKRKALKTRGSDSIFPFTLPPPKEIPLRGSRKTGKKVERKTPSSALVWEKLECT
ncbi:hypothetical protein NPIL_300301 [Nephila pilipes]|uniref:Uncharacterized protein n=1 Tax=Nephila pilipes TaxID=299642 RepID=A0A8X6NRT7_NEPPI|nr:hypothetical protein NPIL_300301 [Nephila pilipes]